MCYYSYIELSNRPTKDQLMDKSQLLSKFIDNKDVVYSGFWVQNARLKSYVENANHSPQNGHINISKLSCKSEVNIVVSNGPIQYSFVFGLLISSGFEELIGARELSLHKLQPILFLDREVEEGHTAHIFVDNKHPDFESLQADIANIFKDSGNTNTDQPCTELQLRRALIEQLSEQLMADTANNENTVLVQQICAVVSQSLTESAISITSVATALLAKPIAAPPSDSTLCDDDQSIIAKTEKMSLVLNLDTDEFALLPLSNKMLMEKHCIGDDNDYCIDDITNDNYQMLVTDLDLSKPSKKAYREAFADFCHRVSGYGVPIMSKTTYALMYDRFIEKNMNGKQILSGMPDNMWDWKECPAWDYLVNHNLEHDGLSEVEIKQMAVEHIKEDPNKNFKHICCIKDQDTVIYTENEQS